MLRIDLAFQVHLKTVRLKNSLGKLGPRELIPLLLLKTIVISMTKAGSMSLLARSFLRSISTSYLRLLRIPQTRTRRGLIFRSLIEGLSFVILILFILTVL